MTIERKDAQSTGKGFFRVLELITESIGWLHIVFSPFFIGLIIGAIIYFYHPTSSGLILAIIVVLLGLVIGIIWATKQWKSKGTIWFLSRILASPELDKPDDIKTKPKNDNELK